MKCLSCQADNREDAKFCIGCGKPLATTSACPACGKQSTSSKFCTHCGHKFRVPVAVVTEPATPSIEAPASSTELSPAPIVAVSPVITVPETAPAPSILVPEEIKQETETPAENSIPAPEPIPVPSPPEKPDHTEILLAVSNPSKEGRSPLPLVAGIVVGLGVLGAAAYIFLKPSSTDSGYQPSISAEQQPAEVKGKESITEPVSLPRVEPSVSGQVSDSNPKEVASPVSAKTPVKPTASAASPKPVPQKTVAAEPVVEPSASTAPPAKAAATDSGQGMSIDELYRMKAEQKCGKRPSGVFQRIPWTVCAEPVRFELCNGKWHDDNRPGMEICKNSNTQAQN